MINSLWPSDAIWWHRSGSTLVQVMAWCRTAQAITWTNVDLSSVRSICIHLRAISQEIPQLSITKISLKITYIYAKYSTNLWGVNEIILGPLSLCRTSTSRFNDQNKCSVVTLIFSWSWLVSRSSTAAIPLRSRVKLASTARCDSYVPWPNSMRDVWTVSIQSSAVITRCNLSWY